MDRDTARKRYTALLREHASGQLGREAFLAEIEKLQYQDEDKNWWQVTEDGTCLKWDGSAWQATNRRIDAPASIPAAGTGAPPPTGAKTESKAGRYFKHILIRIPFVVLSFFATWAIHTYLLADVNGGFGQGGAGNWVFSNWRNFLSSTILWGLLSGFVWMLVFTYFKQGKKNFLPTLTKAPVMMLERIQQAGTPGVGALLIGLGLALFFSPFNVITGNVGVGLALFLAIFGLSSLGWAIARFIARVWLWIVRTVVKKPEEKYGVSLSAAHLVMVGLIPGFIVSLVLKGAFGFVTGVVIIVLGVFLFFELKAPTFSGKAGFLLLVFAPFIIQMLIMACFPDLAFADNGGKAEAGGTWALWWGSQGFSRVLLYGIPPSIASGIGALFPTLTPENLVTIPPEAMVPVGRGTLPITEAATTPAVAGSWPPPIGSEVNGKIWYQPPWDEGGPTFVDKDEYNNIKKMESGGYRWTNHDGWVTDDQLMERRAQEQRGREADRLQSEKNAREFSETDRRIGENQEQQKQIQEEIKDIIRGEPVTIGPYEPGMADRTVTVLTGVQYGIDHTIGVMSNVVPGGKVVATYYTFGKDLGGDLSQGIADWSRDKSGHGLVGTLVKSTATGLIKGAQDYVGDELSGTLMDKAMPDPAGIKRSVVKYVSGYFAGVGIKEGESAVTGLATAHPYEEMVTKPTEEAVFGQKLSEKPLVNVSSLIDTGLKKVGL